MKLYTIKTKFLESNPSGGNKLKDCDEVMNIEFLSNIFNLRELRKSVYPDWYSETAHNLDGGDRNRIIDNGETVTDSGFIRYSKGLPLSSDRYFIGVIDVDHNDQLWAKSILRDRNIDILIE